VKGSDALLEQLSRRDRGLALRMTKGFADDVINNDIITSACQGGNTCSKAGLYCIEIRKYTALDLAIRYHRFKEVNRTVEVGLIKLIV
jgi:hypothetical protein